MDFQQLLQKAKAKQSVVEKKHVQQKSKKKEDKRHKEVLEIQRQREANEKLKRLKEAAARRQLEYKGLHKPSKAATPPSSSHMTSQSSKSASTPSSSKPGGKSRTSDTTAKLKKSETVKGKDSKSSSSSKSVSKSPSSSVSKSSIKPNRPPANFNDLLKMAKVNKKDKPPDQTDYPPRRSSSPLGKSLLEKNSARTGRANGNSSSSLSKASTTKQAPTHTTPQGAIKTESVVRRDPPSGSRGAPRPKLNGQSMSVKNGKSLASLPKATRDGFPPSRPPQRAGASADRTHPDLAARRAAIQRRKAKSAQPTAFYGSAAASILRRKDGGSSGAPFRYTSTWVDQMREEIGELEDLDDLYEEDEDDMDGFVVDSGDDFIDDTGAEDYSYHIKKMFGYDRSRFADEQFDDRTMESSFAQQEFEEERSARIGKLEDDEDIRQEQAKLGKRKRKQSPVRTYGAPKSRLKQAKLSFR